MQHGGPQPLGQPRGAAQVRRLQPVHPARHDPREQPVVRDAVHGDGGAAVDGACRDREADPGGDVRVKPAVRCARAISWVRIVYPALVDGSASVTMWRILVPWPAGTGTGGRAGRDGPPSVRLPGSSMAISARSDRRSRAARQPPAPSSSATASASRPSR